MISNGVLSIEAMGDIADHQLQAGLVRAVEYFRSRNLDPKACYMAYLQDAQKAYSKNWMAAELQANSVLWADPNIRDVRMILGINSSVPITRVDICHSE